MGEYVVIAAFGRPVDLRGWTLMNSRGESYLFGTLTLGQGKGAVIHSGVGIDTGTDLYLGSQKELWRDDGDIAVLLDSVGLEVDRFAY